MQTLWLQPCKQVDVGGSLGWLLSGGGSGLFWCAKPGTVGISHCLTIIYFLSSFQIMYQKTEQLQRASRLL